MRGRKNSILDDSRGALRALPAVGRSLLPIARKDGLNQTQFVNNNNPNSTPLLQFRQCLSARQTWSNGVRQPTAFASVILTNSCSPCLLASYNSVLSCQHATQVLSEAYVAPGAKISVFTTMIRLVKFGYRRLPSDTARHCFLYSSTAYSPQTMKQSLSKT
ncbi:hypothetical protein ZWY2020_032127 [Hordeum vulgare]|nr:hypothetical protein ZWY2020_057568 [Hordeum vulgare]KAI5004884.1 hypothetical protein ZWY2020_032127 [Hordeum vulgare]